MDFNSFCRETETKKIHGITHSPSSHIHFIGIGGVSMYSLARLSLERGNRVSGSDREDSDRLRELQLSGVSVSIGHSADNIADADLVVFSHAISDDNPELCEARRRAVPTVSRAAYLGAMMLDFTRRIGVSGSHGKSSTVAMLDSVFTHALMDHTTLSGADLPIGTPYRIGGEGLLVYEACEYRDSFLSFFPTDFVGLNLELDHTDYFDSLESVKSSFREAMLRTDGSLFINSDDKNLMDIAVNTGKRVVTFGSLGDCDYLYTPTSFGERSIGFSLTRYGTEVGRFELNIPGIFNLTNAAAAITVALEYGIPQDTVAKAISSFSGIPRRLEYIGSRYGRPIYYDYAHHPTEIRAAINALRPMADGGLTVIFRPHTFSRTRAMWREFCEALSLADSVIVTDIFAARERPIEGITAENLARDIPRALYCPDDKILEYLDRHTRGTVILMGAGDYKKLRYSIVKGT